MAKTYANHPATGSQRFLKNVRLTFAAMEKITAAIADSINVKTAVLADAALLTTLQTVIDVCVAALKNGCRLWFCGNGGSAADAQHLAAELSGRFYLDRPALRAEALHGNASYLTAVANDYSFDEIYARLVRGVTSPGDVLLGFSTSGNSANMVNAFEAAKEARLFTVAFTGATGGLLKGLSNYLINVPSADTPRIQEAHILLGHILCQQIEELYFTTQAIG